MSQALLLGHSGSNIEVFLNYIDAWLCPNILKKRVCTKWKEGIFKPS